MMERREYYRLGQGVPIAHRIAGSLLGGSTATADISGGGLSFPTFQKLDSGMVLNLDINLPGSQKAIIAQSRVVWQAENKGLSERFLIGAQFVKIEELDRDKIMRYVTLITRSKYTQNQIEHT